MTNVNDSSRSRILFNSVRDRLPEEESFSSPLHTPRTAAVLGLALGIAFTVCFLTGLLSHLHQHPLTWLPIPSRPAGLYRVTQSLHIATGIAAIPLLLIKLWVVYPQFWTRPAVRNATHAIERLSLFPLVAGALFMLFSGVANVASWYTPMGFFFTSGHYWGAWITIGGLIIHIGAKISTTRLALSRRAPELAAVADGVGMSRRGLLATAAATGGVLTLATIGQTVWPLRRLSVLAPRDPALGPQGHPINKTFADSGIEAVAVADDAYVLSVEGTVPRPFRLTLAELRAMPQYEATLPIQCVEGWSYSATWRGVRVRDLLDHAGASGEAEASVVSLQRNSFYATTSLDRSQAHDADTLLALQLDGEPLAPDHGYPLRLIAPNRPGALQTKWVSKLVVA